jgi:hypothetical protein
MLISCCVQGGPMPGMRPTIGGPGTQPQQPKVRQYKLYTNQLPDTCNMLHSLFGDYNSPEIVSLISGWRQHGCSHAHLHRRHHCVLCVHHHEGRKSRLFPSKLFFRQENWSHFSSRLAFPIFLSCQPWRRLPELYF